MGQTETDEATIGALRSTIDGDVILPGMPTTRMRGASGTG